MRRFSVVWLKVGVGNVEVKTMTPKKYTLSEHRAEVCVCVILDWVILSLCVSEHFRGPCQCCGEMCSIYRICSFGWEESIEPFELKRQHAVRLF